MVQASLIAVYLLLSAVLWAQDEKQTSHPSFNYHDAREHEIKPHRQMISVDGVAGPRNVIRIIMTVSPTGDVIDVKASGREALIKYWPKLQGEVYRWKFVPFEKDGKPVTAEIEEFINLVEPKLPERLPQVHVVAPEIRPDSKIVIKLQRTGCFGTCPAYTVTVSTDGIVFDGGHYVISPGKHTDEVDADAVRKLARDFVAADFYSMDGEYYTMATDGPTYTLTINIDGRGKQVIDRGGRNGMPEVITTLEKKVDEFARTSRWLSKSSMQP